MNLYTLDSGTKKITVGAVVVAVRAAVAEEATAQQIRAVLQLHRALHVAHIEVQSQGLQPDVAGTEPAEPAPREL